METQHNKRIESDRPKRCALCLRSGLRRPLMLHVMLEQTYAFAYAETTEGAFMTILNATEARSRLYSLIDETTSTHQPIVITGKRGNAVLVSEEDWNAISETLNLISIPGMRESIREGLETPVSDCGSELDW